MGKDGKDRQAEYKQRLKDNGKEFVKFALEREYIEQALKLFAGKGKQQALHDALVLGLTSKKQDTAQINILDVERDKMLEKLAAIKVLAAAACADISAATNKTKQPDPAKIPTSYTPPDNMPVRLKVLWRTHKPVKTLAEASESMGMKSQYFGQLCNAQSLCTAESVLKIAAFFDIHPKELDPNFPVWAMHARGADDTVAMPMQKYTPSDKALQNVRKIWDDYKESGNTNLYLAAPIMGIAVTTLSAYFTGQIVLKGEFLLKFCTLTNTHPRDIDAQFPAHFLTRFPRSHAPAWECSQDAPASRTARG